MYKIVGPSGQVTNLVSILSVGFFINVAVFQNAILLLSSFVSPEYSRFCLLSSVAEAHQAKN